MLDDALEFALAPERARRQLEALLLRADPEFVRCAYLGAAAREPTSLEYAEMLRRLRAGASRLSLLTDLLASADASPCDGASWLRDSLRDERLNGFSLHPLRWLVRLYFRRLLSKVPGASRNRFESKANGKPGTTDEADPRVADRVYRHLCSALAPKRR